MRGGLLMKVLFVTSGNSRTNQISPFTLAQGESLREHGVEVDYFPVIGKGAMNYLRNAGRLRRKLRDEPVDLIHAHYSLSGWVAVLATRGAPVVLSLMGDDAQGTFVGKNRLEFKSRLLMMLTIMIQPFVRAIISKSSGIERIVYRKNISYVIPNGVQMRKFQASASGFRDQLGLEPDRRYVLFLGSPVDANKNMKLVKEALNILGRADVELLNVYKAGHDEVVRYLNSVDVFVLCSFAEGSANVVKEAMACNCPMVVTDAGDASWVVGDTPGCFVSTHEPADFAKDLGKALEYAEMYGRTTGRQRLMDIGLDADTVAQRIKDVYTKVLSGNSGDQNRQHAV